MMNADAWSSKQGAMRKGMVEGEAFFDKRKQTLPGVGRGRQKRKKKKLTEGGKHETAGGKHACSTRCGRSPNCNSGLAAITPLPNACAGPQLAIFT